MIRGYARVSTEDQELGRQIVALSSAGAEKIYQDKVSGADMTNRPALVQMLADLQPGDRVIVHKLDRFARSVKDLANMLEALDKRGVKFQSLTEGLSTDTALSRFMLQILGVVAEFERELMRDRIKDGMKHCKRLGRKFGRPQVDQGATMLEIARLEDEGLSREEVCAAMGITRYKYYAAKKWGSSQPQPEGEAREGEHGINGEMAQDSQHR